MVVDAAWSCLLDESNIIIVLSTGATSLPPPTIIFLSLPLSTGDPLTFLLFSPGALCGAGVSAGPFAFLAGLGGSYDTPPLSVANFSFAESSSACRKTYQQYNMRTNIFPTEAVSTGSSIRV